MNACDLCGKDISDDAVFVHRDHDAHEMFCLCETCEDDHEAWGRQCASDEDLQRRLRAQERYAEDLVCAAEEAADARRDDVWSQQS